MARRNSNDIWAFQKRLAIYVRTHETFYGFPTVETTILFHTSFERKQQMLFLILFLIGEQTNLGHTRPL